MWGDRVLYYEDAITFKDEKNKLQCEVLFNAEAVGFIKGMFTKQKQPVDYFRGEIVRLSAEKSKKKDVISVIEGSWLDHMDVDGKRYVFFSFFLSFFQKLIPSVILACGPLRRHCHT